MQSTCYLEAHDATRRLLLTINERYNEQTSGNESAHTRAIEHERLDEINDTARHTQRHERRQIRQREEETEAKQKTEQGNEHRKLSSWRM